jgi:hypothetical protein
MSSSFANITLLLQTEQAELLEREEELCQELQSIQIYSKELKQKAIELDKRSAKLDEEIELRKDEEDARSDSESESEDLEMFEISEEDLEALRKAIEEQEDIERSLENHEIGGGEDLEEEMIKKLEAMKEEVELLKEKRFRTEFEIRELCESSEQFEEYQNMTKEQKRYLQSDFKKLMKTNEDNFEKYSELLNIKEALDLELSDLDTEMDRLRKENKRMNKSTKDLKQLKSGLDEQEKINQILQEKLETLERKTYEKKRELEHQVLKANFENEDLNYELDNSFKIDVLLNSKNQPSKIGSKLSQYQKRQLIIKNKRTIEQLELKASELSNGMLEEAALQEGLLQREMQLNQFEQLAAEYPRVTEKENQPMGLDRLGKMEVKERYEGFENFLGKGESENFLLNHKLKSL